MMSKLIPLMMYFFLPFAFEVKRLVALLMAFSALAIPKITKIAKTYLIDF